MYASQSSCLEEDEDDDDDEGEELPVLQLVSVPGAVAAVVVVAAIAAGNQFRLTGINMSTALILLLGVGSHLESLCGNICFLHVVDNDCLVVDLSL